MIVAATGLVAYFAGKTDYARIPDVARIFSEVVMHRQDYEKTLLAEISGTKNEGTANAMVETGCAARKRINAGISPAENFTRDPYDLRIEIKHTANGDETYLADLASNQRLPIYENNQVGDLSHRITGIRSDAGKLITDIFDEAKKTALETIDEFVNMLGGELE